MARSKRYKTTFYVLARLIEIYITNILFNLCLIRFKYIIMWINVHIHPGSDIYSENSKKSFKLIPVFFKFLHICMYVGILLTDLCILSFYYSAFLQQ